jgi:hypothetical protein
MTFFSAQEMRRLREAFDELNNRVFHPVGLNLLWPRNVAFLFVRLLRAHPSLFLLCVDRSHFLSLLLLSNSSK